LTPILVPRFGVAMTEATLVEWSVPDGSFVTAGQPIARIETEKVEAEVEAPVAGLLRIGAETAQIYSVGTQLGEIVPAPAP
jgi:pyruvate/2-oxoglutarate dehydrogenase complex dihydrolipoamide acyltransferase (E2) component